MRKFTVHLQPNLNSSQGLGPYSGIGSRDTLWILAIATLGAVALGIRVWGLCFGLPYFCHIDEPHYIAGALSMVRTHFNVPIVTHGPNLFYMILLAEDIAYFVILRLLGTIHTWTALEQVFQLDPSAFILMARFTSAFFGVLTLIPTYLIGKRLDCRPVGFAASVLLAFTFQHVRESHFGTPDVFVGFLVTCCLFMCIVMLQTGRTRNYVLCGIFGGLATGTKFTNLLLWIPILVAHLSAMRRELGESGVKLIPFSRRFLSRKLLAAALGFGLGLVVAYPNSLFRPGAFLAYLRFLMDVGETGFITQFVIEPAPAWFYYAFSLTWGMGWIMLAFVGLGLITVAFERRPEQVLLVTFIMFYLVFLARSPYYASRYTVSLLPGLCLIAALGVRKLTALIRRRKDTMAMVIYGSLITLAVLQPLAFSVRHDYLQTKEDTRIVAKDWIEANIPEGSTIAVDWEVHTPPLKTVEDSSHPSRIQYNVREAHGIGLPRYTVGEYQEADVEYLVMSSFINDLKLSSIVDSAAKKHFYETLDGSYELIYRAKPYLGENKPSFVFDQIFGPVTSLWQFEQPGPTIEVYRIR